MIPREALELVWPFRDVMIVSRGWCSTPHWPVTAGVIPSGRGHNLWQRAVLREGGWDLSAANLPCSWAMCVSCWRGFCTAPHHIHYSNFQTTVQSSRPIFTTASPWSPSDPVFSLFIPEIQPPYLQDTSRCLCHYHWVQRSQSSKHILGITSQNSSDCREWESYAP